MNPSDVIANRYQIEAQLGSGGMGTVYRARDLHTDTTVAIKALRMEVVAEDPTLLQRFMNESEALRRLNHPNIVKILDSLTDDAGRHYIVMEYVSGGSLFETLRAQPHMPIDRLLEIALDVADALTRAHRVRIIHRDVKPHNVLIADDGTPRLTDFGVAQMQDQQRMTMMGDILGTVVYLSPEVAKGYPYDERSDIWSFGVMLFEMLTGRRPFDEGRASATLNAIVLNPLPDMRQFRPDAPPALVTLIERMLVKDPDARIASVRAVGAELEAIQRGDTAASRFNTPSTLLDRPVSVASAPDAAPAPTPAAAPTPPPTPRVRDAAPTPTPAPAPTPIRTRNLANPRIFISYRREDVGAAADVLVEQLGAAFGAGNIQMDIDRLSLRTVSRLVLARDVVGSSDLLVALIGRRWLDALNDPKDPVRQELEAGLKDAARPVVTVLVDDAPPPTAAQLPPTLSRLAQVTPVRITTEGAAADSRRVVQAVRRALNIETARFPYPLLIVLAVVLILLLIAAVVTAVTGTQAASATPTLPVIEPVSADETMILVADLEATGGVTPRDVARFIADDLREQLETGIPFSPMRIRRYPVVVTTERAAAAVANQTGAAIIVWGNYTPTFVELNIQLGALSADLALDPALIRRSADVRVRLSDERSESVARTVMGAYTTLSLVRGDGYEALRTISVLNALTTPEVEILSTGVSAFLHRAAYRYVRDPQGALAIMNEAQSLDSTNPLVYVYRSTVHLVAGAVDASQQDAQAAQRLASPDWVMPYYLLTNVAQARDDYPQAIALYNELLALRPDDWFTYNYLGALHYATGDYATARSHYDRALALGATENFPYPLATLLALRAGEITQARQLIQTMLTRFPDPFSATRVIQASYGDTDIFPWGAAFSAFGNLIIGQYAQAAHDAEQAVALNPALTDLYLVQGFAYCNLGDNAAAEAAYTRVLDADPSFAIVYLLRAEVRSHQGNVFGALSDLNAARGANPSDEVQALIDAAVSGGAVVTCRDLFTPASTPPAAVPATFTPGVTSGLTR